MKRRPLVRVDLFRCARFVPRLPGPRLARGFRVTRNEYFEPACRCGRRHTPPVDDHALHCSRIKQSVKHLPVKRRFLRNFFMEIVPFLNNEIHQVFPANLDFRYLQGKDHAVVAEDQRITHRNP